MTKTEETGRKGDGKRVISNCEKRIAKTTTADWDIRVSGDPEGNCEFRKACASHMDYDDKKPDYGDEKTAETKTAYQNNRGSGTGTPE